jgi:ubiquinone/menaquinone biosynthesis C-methylase UbiE
LGVGIFNHKEHKEHREKTSTRCCEASHLEIDLCALCVLCGELIEVIDKPSKGKSNVNPETADIESSTDAYAQRFAGPTGEWMLSRQETITKTLLRHHCPGATVLDVGGGHGQLAIPLGKSGFDVTVLGSTPECAQRLQAAIDANQCRFTTGNVIALPFADNSFDVAISFRLLTHCVQWPVLVTELCRVARTDVVIDYPATQSLNCIAPWLFDAKRKYETNTRFWRSFRHDEMIGTFAANGFELTRMKKQFFLPMVVHRMLKCQPVSAAAEAVCRALMLTRLAGSPVIARFTARPATSS